MPYIADEIKSYITFQVESCKDNPDGTRTIYFAEELFPDNVSIDRVEIIEVRCYDGRIISGVQYDHKAYFSRNDLDCLYKTIK